MNLILTRIPGIENSRYALRQCYIILMFFHGGAFLSEHIENQTPWSYATLHSNFAVLLYIYSATVEQSNVILRIILTVEEFLTKGTAETQPILIFVICFIIGSLVLAFSFFFVFFLIFTNFQYLFLVHKQLYCYHKVTAYINVRWTWYQNLYKCKVSPYMNVRYYLKLMFGDTLH